MQHFHEVPGIASAVSIVIKPMGAWNVGNERNDVWWGSVAGECGVAGEGGAREGVGGGG